jgi:hypothetical protein
MAITTSDNVYDHGIGGTGKSKMLCWECGKPDKVMTIGSATPYRYCRACVTKLGIKPVPIELAEKE